MLSFLALAAAILTVSSAFAWRAADNSQQRESAVRADALQGKAVQEYSRRLERALAVINLAAASPEFLQQLSASGESTVGAGEPASSDGQATVRLITSSDAELAPKGITPAMTSPVSGAAVVGGKPVALAAAPVFSPQGQAGGLIASVDLEPVLTYLQQGGNPAAWELINLDGSVNPLADSGGAAATATASSMVTSVDLGELLAGKPVPLPGAGADSTLLPLPQTGGGPILAVSAVNQVADSGAATANPFLGLAVLTIALGLFVSHFLARALSRPVEQITEATERVAAGDISYQLPPIRGNDELSVLHDSFNRMTSKYCRSQAEVETAAVRLQQTVAAQDIEIQTLFGISRAITSILDVNDMLEQALGLCLPLVGGRCGVIWLSSALKQPSPAEEEPAAALVAAAAVGLKGMPAAPVAGDHALLTDHAERQWKLSVNLPGDESAGRELFFASGEGAAPFTITVEERSPGRLPDGEDAAACTQVIVPVLGHQGLPRGMMSLSIDGRRELTEHEALLLFNISNLTSVAIENAGLYDLAHSRGEQVATLLKESHHRITNNLAAITGLLSIQSSRIQAPELSGVIEDNIARISSIAHVHRLLSGELRDEVEIREMIVSIATPTVKATGGDNVALNVRGEHLTLPAKQATAVALIINELVINSIKHGFAGREGGTITIDVSLERNTAAIRYADDGSTAGSQPRPATSTAGLGLQIINSLVEGDLAGSWEQEAGRGYRAVIRFPVIFSPKAG